VLRPDLSVPPDQWSQTVKLAHNAFRSPGWAYFLVDQPTSVRATEDNTGDGVYGNHDTGSLTWHYSAQIHHAMRNLVLALNGGK